jgi:ribose-phosphate pyrophosphokinase
MQIVITDTLPIYGNVDKSKIKVLSTAPMLGEAINRIHRGLSVGEMFSSF